jgi:hypothetical protein
LDYEDGRLAARRLNERRADALKDLERATETLVDAEREYREDRSRRIVEATGTSIEKKEFVDGKTAVSRAKRDGAEWAVKLVQEKLAELDGQRASLHRLIEWSMRLDPRAAEVYAQRMDSRRTTVN